VDYCEDELSSIIPSEFGETVTEICEESGAAELIERVDIWNESLDKAEKKNTKLKNDMKELQERLEHLLEEIVSIREELDGEKSSRRVFAIPKLGLSKAFHPISLSSAEPGGHRTASGEEKSQAKM